MAKTRNLECVSCEALFSVDHSMDDKYYVVEWCPFCGDELEIEDSMDDDYLEVEEDLE